MMEGWNDLLPTSNGNSPERIQWTPTPFGQVRIKLVKNKVWTEPVARKGALDALHTGDQLINDRKRCRR